jgi:hypothetical protein
MTPTAATPRVGETGLPYDSATSGKLRARLISMAHQPNPKFATEEEEASWSEVKISDAVGGAAKDVIVP